MLPPDCAPSSIPEDAEEVLTGSFDENQLIYDCVVNGEKVGTRNRRADGRLNIETGWRGERPHGWRRFWDDRDNTLVWEEFMVDGREHGVVRQWSQSRLIGWYLMDHGTGVDLWRNDDGSLSEERYLKDGQWHGFERWWSHQSNTTTWLEKHFYENVEHGIERQWNGEGRIRRGYPRYFVNGQRVSKRQYLSACQRDPTLPPYRPEDDRPERPLPPEYFTTMPPAVPPTMPANPADWRPETTAP
jgi:hypothetical protein